MTELRRRALVLGSSYPAEGDCWNDPLTVSVVVPVRAEKRWQQRRAAVEFAPAQRLRAVSSFRPQSLGATTLRRAGGRDIALIVRARPGTAGFEGNSFFAEPPAL
jgi:hypothetical protein